MCGIVAIMRFDGAPVNEAHLDAMRDQLYHRGPDDAGTRIDGHVGLSQRRLSIIDLSPDGHNPMPNEDGTVWITFNGEIYNYVELRAELIARGHRFRSHTDTETIVHLWEEEGERCVERLGGMFAFVIWDSRRRVFFAARDRIGIKPFHYYADARQFVCASEAKAILAAPGVTAAADYQGIADYLFNGFPLGERTLFSGIRQLPPGHSLTVTAEGVRVRKYWDVQYNYQTGRSAAQIEDALADLLDDAARIHCRSDAELGCHLSGGLDSSTVTGLAARHRASMKTFSIRFGEGGWYDETAFAKAQAAHVGASYYEAVPNGNDLGVALPGLLWHMEMPLPNLGGFSYYTVSRLASKHVKVTLTGHGGDEVFAGYPAQFQTAFGTNPFPPGGEPDVDPRRSLYAVMRDLGQKVAKRGVRWAVSRVVGNAKKTPEQLWMGLHCGREPATNPLVGSRFVETLAGYSPVDNYLTAFRTAPTDELLDKCLYHDLRCYLPGLLYMEDRVSMSVSVESRVPLLDHRIVEFMATVPPLQKVPGMIPKGLLRAAARNAIPDMIRNRTDKRPFPVPFRVWIRDVLEPMAKEVLQSPQCLDRGVINAGRARRWDFNHSELWGALNIELWFRIFIDRDPVWVERAKLLPTVSSRG
jgi:asparagine synthase (glutamine-hydrolysing)